MEGYSINGNSSGNLDANLLFVDAFNGNPRLLDGDGKAAVDMGVYEAAIFAQSSGSALYLPAIVP